MEERRKPEKKGKENLGLKTGFVWEGLICSR